MDIELRRLERADIADREILFHYDSPGHYRVRIDEKPGGWAISLEREAFRETFRKEEREKLLASYKADSEIHGAFAGGAEVGLIQFVYTEHNKSVRVWDIDVINGLRRKGVGRALMDLCKARAKELGARRIILETQTCNLKAIEFYRAMGFVLAGLDATHYQNDDLERGEVRLEMAYYL